ncbi:MAG: hypothetical protein KC964_24640, partial [Candidatus Omnitrophica bacterium]|nr:hypothetical protein [Candidatus Omnitrophota bacterium]
MKVFRREIQLVILSLLVLTMEAIGQNEADFRQWNFDDGEKAFAKVLHCDFEIKDGVFSGVIEGNDVALILPFTDLEPPLRLKMRIRSGEGAFGRGEIYWRTDASQGFEHDRTAMYLMDHDWTWREYDFPIPAMEGPIQVRFDPGWKKGKVEIDWIRLEEDPIPESIRKLNESLPETLTISSDQLSLEMRPLKSEFEVTQKETGRIWTGSFSDLQGLVVEASAESPSRIQVSLWDPATRQIYDTTIEFEEEHSLSLSLDTQKKDSTFWAFREWPPALESNLKEGKIFFCDRSSGTYIDQDDEAYGGENLLVYGNTTCMDMPWIGLMESETGEGVMLLVESPADAEVALSTDSNELIWPQIRWKPSMDSFRYARKASYRFFDKGGYVAMAKDYREIARNNGLLVTLQEKAKSRPLVHRLKGAPPVWGDTDGWEFVQQARTLGMSRGILSNVHHGLKDKSRVEDINALGFLTCEYDSFSDIQDGPTGFQKDDVEETAYHLRPGLGPKAGWTTQEGFSYYDRSSAFAVRALKTYVPFRMDEWKFNARFIDVSMAKELHEDYHPAHTFDRRQDLEYRREAFEYYR